MKSSLSGIIMAILAAAPLAAIPLALPSVPVAAKEAQVLPAATLTQTFR